VNGQATGFRAEELLALDRAALAERLRTGHPIDPAALAGWVYRGVSLGLPGWVDRLAWKTFAKVFHADGGGVRGWNVRLRQGDQHAVEPLRDRRGLARCFGHFDVVASPDGLVLDYASARNGRLDPIRRLRDPLVALRAGEADLLLGCSRLALAGHEVQTPSWFVLERRTRVEDFPPMSALVTP